jgi:hypothetical protein
VRDEQDIWSASVMMASLMLLRNLSSMKGAPSEKKKRDVFYRKIEMSLIHRLDFMLNSQAEQVAGESEIRRELCRPRRVDHGTATLVPNQEWRESVSENITHN